MTLEQLPTGQRALIAEVQGEDGLRARMLALMPFKAVGR